MGGDLRSSEADALYRPLGGLDVWAAVAVDGAAWDHGLRRMEALRTSAPHWADMVARGAVLAAAHQSGALAGLFPANRAGALALLAGEATPSTIGGPEVGAHVRAGAAAMVVAGEGGVSEENLRRLHAVACAPQVTHAVDGHHDHVLGHGDYKHHPNSVLDPDRPGGWRAAAPVDDVRGETARLVEALASERLARLHPVVRAAFALHGVHHIRPFAAGNGRVARALAAAPLLEAVGLPLLVFADQAADYRRALAAADEGVPARLVELVQRRCDELIALLTGLAAAELGGGGGPLQRWRQRSKAADRLHTAVAAGAERALDRHRARPDLGWLAPLEGAAVDAGASRGRGRPLQAATVVVRAPLPSEASVDETLSIDGHPLDVDGAVVLSAASAELRLDLELTALVPEVSAPAAAALEGWLERVVTALAVRVAAEGD